MFDYTEKEVVENAVGGDSDGEEEWTGQIMLCRVWQSSLCSMQKRSSFLFCNNNPHTFTFQ